MDSVEVHCWNPKCGGRLVLDCREHDQAVTCGTCKQVRTFVNLGAVDCPNCRHANRVSLNHWDLVAHGLRCNRCGDALRQRGAVRVFPLDHYMKDEFGRDEELAP